MIIWNAANRKAYIVLIIQMLHQVKKKKLHGTALWLYSPATRSGPDVLYKILSSNNYYYNILIIFNDIEILKLSKLLI